MDSLMNTNLPFPFPDAVQEFSVETSNMSLDQGNSSQVSQRSPLAGKYGAAPSPNGVGRISNVPDFHQRTAK